MNLYKSIFLYLLFCLHLYGVISPSFVSADKASVATGAGVTSLSTSGTNHVNGRALVALVRIGTPAASVSSITNTAGDTWVACSPAKTATIGNVQWWYTLSTAGNSNDIVTVNFSPISVYASVIVGQISGIDNSGIDVCSGNTGNSGTGTAITATSFTTSTNEEIILQGAIWDNLGITTTADTGYTAVADIDGMGGLQYKTVASIQTGITPTLTISASQQWVGQILTLKGSGVLPTGPTCSLTPTATLFSGSTKWTQKTNTSFSVFGDCTGTGTITYSWAQVGTTPAVLSLSNSTTSTVTASGNSVFGDYTLRLSATDFYGTDTFDIDIGSVPTDVAGRVQMSTVDPTNGSRIDSLIGPLYIIDGSGRWPWKDDRAKYMADRILSFRSSEYSGYHNFPRPGTITLTGGSTTVTGSETNFRDDDAGPCMTDGTVKGGAFIWWQYTGYNDGLTHFGAPAYDNGSSSYIASCTSDTQLTLRNQYPSNSSINASMEYPRCDSAPAACVGLTWGFGSDGTATSYNGYSAAWQYGEKPANYYDNIVALYKLYYTTGLTYYRTQARLFCDDWWKNPDIDRGQQLDYDYRWGLNAMPRRSWSFTGLELCALEQSDSAMFSSFRTHSYKLWKYYIDTLFAANAPVANFQESFDLRDMAYMQKYTADCVIIETDATAKTGCVNALASADDSWIASQGLHGAFYAWWGDGGSQFTGHGANTNGTTTITLNSGDTCPSGTYWFVFWSGDPTTRPAFGTEDQTYYTGTCNGTGTITLTTAYTGSNSSNKGWIRSKSTSGGDGYPLVGWGVDNFYNGLLLLAFEQSAIAMDGIDNTSRDKYRTLANDIAAFIRDYEYDSTLTGINVFYSPLCVVGNNSLCNQRNDGDTGANLLAAEGIGGMAMNAIRTGDVTIKNLALLFEDQNFCKASTNCTGSVSSSYQVEINDGGSYVSGTPPTGTNAKYYGTFYGMPNNSAVQALVGTSLSTAISGSLPISGPTVVR